MVKRCKFSLESEIGDVCIEKSSKRKTICCLLTMEVELDFEDFVGEAVGEKESQVLDDSDETKIETSDKKSLEENEETEDGQCCNTPEKNTSCEKKDDCVEEDDGELCTDEEDLEEGELKEDGDENTPKQRQVCRFFHRGTCFYGSYCRFLHDVNSDKGNYNMFAPTPPPTHPGFSDSYGPGPKINPRLNSRSLPDYIPPLPPPPPMRVQAPQPPLESAWDRGLKEAKTLVKKANKRKEKDPDFNEKRLNLSLKANEKNLPEFDKENDCKPKRRKGKDYLSNRPPRHNYRRWNDARLEEIQSKCDDFFDPWRRSMSPKGHRPAPSRSASYSSVSSSDRYSDRSSYSYSHSSSPSSRRSSRRTSSSRSRSVSRTPSRSRSRSLSMSSVSSASSSVSHSSSGSGSLKHRSGHASQQRKDGKFVASSNRFGVKRGSRIDRSKDLSCIGGFDEEVDPLEESFQITQSDSVPFSSEQHLALNVPEKSKDPVKNSHKQQIKLTLLNKNLSKSSDLLKKDPKTFKKQPDDSPKSNHFYQSGKRPLSPPRIAPAPPPKKHTSSRRDELLMQLKAVEDAIARKRAKF